VADNDVIGLQRAVVVLVTDDDAREAFVADPSGYAAGRLSGSAAVALAGVDPVGVQAFTLSHVAKKARFDHLHQLHHELEARKAAEAAEREAHSHDHDHGHHAHDHGHDEHDHGHEDHGHPTHDDHDHGQHAHDDSGYHVHDAEDPS
jgi:hypothetical protein